MSLQVCQAAVSGVPALSSFLRRDLEFSRIPAALGFPWFSIESFRRHRTVSTEEPSTLALGAAGQQRSVNDRRLTSVSGGPCDRGNLCRRQAELGMAGGTEGHTGALGLAGGEALGWGREVCAAGRRATARYRDARAGGGSVAAGWQRPVGSSRRANQGRRSKAHPARLSRIADHGTKFNAAPCARPSSHHADGRVDGRCGPPPAVDQRRAVR
jgi:hypothetical protein